MCENVKNRLMYWGVLLCSGITMRSGGWWSRWYYTATPTSATPRLLRLPFDRQAISRIHISGRLSSWQLIQLQCNCISWQIVKGGVPSIPCQRIFKFYAGRSVKGGVCWQIGKGIVCWCKCAIELDCQLEYWHSVKSMFHFDTATIFVK